MAAVQIILSLLILFLSVILVVWVVRVAKRYALKTTRIRHGLTIRGTEVLGEDEYHKLLADIVTVIGWIIGAVALYFVLGLVFTLLPVTERFGRVILQSIENRVLAIGNGIIAAVPNMFQIIVIIITATLISRVLSHVMLQVEKGNISLRPFVPSELARPALYIGNVLIALITLAAIVPLIPGLSSQGELLILVAGAIFTLASSTTIANVISGFVLAYMRPFNTGNMVRIGAVFGMVKEKSLLYTRIITPKNEDVLIPNQQVLSGEIINLSSIEQGLILFTSVTIGYDVPRTVVEKLLLEAAVKVEYAKPGSEPFVLVTELSDFYVNYEINMYVTDRSQIPRVLSQLRKNIKDSFDAAGVEIMSAHYSAIRDGNKSTIPPQGPVS